MNKRNVLKYAVLNASAAVLYVILIALFINFLSLNNTGDAKSVIVPISMLMLFVFSAAFMGIIVFGRPVVWYFDGKKREALSLLFYTLGIFLVVTVLFLFILTMLI